MSNVKIVAFYLPQFYEFPENNEWWGEGFTEWTNVKKSKPLFEGHYQPTVPLNKNYYYLDNDETIKWQIGLAKKFGVYGFCFYHYWFGNKKMLMEKPVERYLENKEFDFPFCMCWANHNWTRTWVGGDKEILMEVQYGDKKDWKEHFEYLLPYFSDFRYIRIDGKPVLVIYQPELIPNYDEMRKYINELAKENGLGGITFISQAPNCAWAGGMDGIDYCIQYEPDYSCNSLTKVLKSALRCNAYHFIFDKIQYRIKWKIKQLTNSRLCKVVLYDYDAVWEFILKREVKNKKMIAGAFVKCDVTPRRQDRAIIYNNFSVDKFEKYMQLLVEKVEKEFYQQYIFIMAWNEWGEGAYLEPDEKYGYGCLQAIRNVMDREEGTN